MLLQVQASNSRYHYLLFIELPKWLTPTTQLRGDLITSIIATKHFLRLPHMQKSSIMISTKCILPLLNIHVCTSYDNIDIKRTRGLPAVNTRASQSYNLSLSHSWQSNELFLHDLDAIFWGLNNYCWISIFLGEKNGSPTKIPVILRIEGVDLFLQMGAFCWWPRTAQNEKPYHVS